MSQSLVLPNANTHTGTGEIAPEGNAILDALLTHKSLLILAVAVAAELLLPFLIWKGGLPGVTRWLGDAIVFALLGLTFVRMLLDDRIPIAALIVLFLTCVGVVTAAYEGQALAATLWGWWLMFKYPIIGLYAYLCTDWPKAVARWIFNGCMTILSVQLLVQVGQYLTGEVPGDNLAGTFAKHGVSPLAAFVFLTVCIASGYWIATGNWQYLIYASLVGGGSSLLAVTKFYFPAIVALAVVAVLIYAIRGGKLHSALIYLLLSAIFIVAFAYLYNIIADARGLRNFEDYFDLSISQRYFGSARYDADDGRYHLGRNFSLQHGWELLQRDTTTTLFGYGLGARGESTSLGIIGGGLEDSLYGIATGTSLLILLQELGLVGMGLFGLFSIWTCRVLWQFAAVADDPYEKTFCYGLLIYSIFWPIWLWYDGTWSFAVAMILYWALLGFVLSRYQQSRSYARLS